MFYFPTISVNWNWNKESIEMNDKETADILPDVNNERIVSLHIQEQEISWASEFISERCEQFSQTLTANEPPAIARFIISPPPKIEGDCSYSQLIRQLQKDRVGEEHIPWFHSAERLVLALALMQHLSPVGLLPLVNLATDSTMKCLIGLSHSIHHQLIIPSIETALFLIAGNNLKIRREALEIFSKSHLFSRLAILNFPQPALPAIKSASPILLNDEFYSLLVEGKPYSPGFSLDFGAYLLEVRESWEDFIAHEETLYALKDISLWLTHRHKMVQDPQINKRIKNGYRALFYGPSGTGKTMSAGLIGKHANLPVYRVDLSTVVSKYVGETEKNLEAIFQKAENKDWILFFDEADALFGKRTQTKSSNDRYANQEVSYLLQRIEDFNGLVILSSNLKSNMDDAFVRRFQNIARFNPPDEDMRRIMFLKAFSGKFSLLDDSLLEEACNKKYGLTGADINNIFRYCAMRVLNNNGQGVSGDDFKNGLITELKKKGKL